MKSLFIGRYQVPGGIHDGHKALFETVLKEGKSIVIAIRDTAVDKKNPFLAVDRQAMIIEAMKSWGDKVEVIIIPDIEEVCYGREVGWGIRQIHLSKDIEDISATQIRKETIEVRQAQRQKVHDAKSTKVVIDLDPHQHTFIFYHGGCLDGFGAAAIAHRVLGDENVTYIPCSYHDQKSVDPLEKAISLIKSAKVINLKMTSVVLLDFTFPRDVLLNMQSRLAELTVIDHHRSAQKELMGLDFCIFDMNKSGAMLAWEYWFPHEPPPKLIEYTQDRDLWLHKLPGSKEVAAAMLSQVQSFEVWDNLINDGLEAIEDLKKDGGIILTHQNQMVDTICKEVMWQTIGGHLVPLVNTSIYFSDVANKLCQIYPDAAFAAYYYDVPGIRQYGLRSLPEGIDVSIIAKLYNGGGHVHAAGFIVKVGRLTELKPILKDDKI